MSYSDFDFSFSYNIGYLIAGVILISLYTWFVYRTTIPQVSKLFKSFLFFLRFAALIIILFSMFEPVLTLVYKEEIEPEHLVFIDNSKSILLSDSIQSKEKIEGLLQRIKNETNTQIVYHSFGKKVIPIQNGEFEKIDFSESATNFENIFDDQNFAQKNIASILILSDGRHNSGSLPTYQAEKLGIPIFTIGVGDTTEQKDVWINNIQYNSYIYADKETVINVIINNNQLENNKTVVTIYEDGKAIGNQEILLSETGVNRVQYNYKPTSAGEKKITVSVSNIDGETSYVNNRKSVFINVLNNKIKVLLVGGAPSKDYSIIKQELESNENLEIKRLVQISSDKFLDTTNPLQLLKDSEILFLIGFPSKATSYQLLNQVKSEIESNGKPFFILINSDTDLIRLKLFEDILTVNISQINSGYDSVQPIVKASQNPIMKNGLENIFEWETLPPVLMNNSSFKTKANSKVLAEIKIKNIPISKPLISTIRLGNIQSISVIASEIWRWKIQSAGKSEILFNSFIQNSIKWLNTNSKQKPVTIKPIKKMFQNGERVEFTAQIYDETFTKIENAEVVVKIISDKGNYETILTSVGNGIYDGSIDALAAADYTYSAYAKVNDTELGNDNGRFTVSAVDLELMNPKADVEFLRLLATVSNGDYAYITEADKIFEKMKKTSAGTNQINEHNNIYELWANEWLLYLIIILFALEWFFRKRAGML